MQKTRQKLLLTALLLTFIFIEPCVGFQKNKNDTIPQFNFDFEKFANDKSLPDDWVLWGNKEAYHILADSLETVSGDYSVSIQSKDSIGDAFGCIAYKIPNGYKGKSITLEGNIKTEGVTGYAGLLLRLDVDNNPVSFDNMQSQNLQGTNDWKKYSITVPFKSNADVIYVGALSLGEGKAWFDNFKLTIDGVDIQSLTPVEKELTKAELDKTFDNGSDFQLDVYNEKTIKNLNKLCKTWGYLKYHHPKVAKGDYNWDYELFRFLPKVKSDGFDANLQEWEKSYGKIGSDSLTNHYYINFAANVKNPEFTNERTYSDMDWGDDGFRLLALFRYWNMIEYFFPYKHLTDKNWDEVLVEYIPKILEADDEQSYKLTLLQLIGEVQDTHANIWQQDVVLDEFFGTQIIPIKIEFIENKALVTKVYDDYKEDESIVVGTEITAINGKSITELIEERKSYYPASNRPTQLRDMARKLLRTNEEKLQLTFSDGKTEKTKYIATIDVGELSFYEDDNTSHKELENGKIGYIYPGKLASGEIDDIMEKFKDKKGIVIDFRCYPSDFTVFSLGSHLMPKPTEFVKFTTTSLKNPGEFTFGETLETGTDNPDYYKGKIAILINETTQSSAEYHTMAFRVAPKAKVFGSQTAGADGNVSRIYLPGNINTMISGIGVYYPDGTETQRIGIVPDIEVKPTIQGIREGKDEVLEAALQFINND